MASPASSESHVQRELTPPFRATVSSIVSSRYPHHTRPADWDLRSEGFDQIKLTDGTVLTLLSDGQQSPPQPGWEILITGGDRESGFHWTLYGLPVRK